LRERADRKREQDDGQDEAKRLHGWISRLVPPTTSPRERASAADSLNILLY
jgi:hypothetical protein